MIDVIDAIDAIDELVARSKDHPALRALHRFHRENPYVLDWLVKEIQLRLDSGFDAFSFGGLFDYGRWKLAVPNRQDTYFLNDRYTALFGRMITILHPEFNGKAEFRESMADGLFGTRIAPIAAKLPEDYARRLEWANGTALELGWQPKCPHVVRLAALTRADIHPREALHG
jgi:hypothetical protein